MSREMWSPLDKAIVGPQLLKAAEIKSQEIRTRYSPDMAPFIDENVYGRAAVLADLKRVMAQEQD